MRGGEKVTGEKQKRTDGSVYVIGVREGENSHRREAKDNVKGV